MVRVQRSMIRERGEKKDEKYMDGEWKENEDKVAIM